MNCRDIILIMYSKRKYSVCLESLDGSANMGMSQKEKRTWMESVNCLEKLTVYCVHMLQGWWQNDS